ncbi:Uncharacterised protein [Halioglobus japonicus]|nr:Uncharacterised protein [Halioglobus japonicus]
MSDWGVDSTQLSGTFRQVSSGLSKPTSTARKTKPFAIRFTEEERAYLEERAGKRPLGAYCRDKLLGDKSEKRRELRTP